ncbi:trypsin-like peptidase domain-containing protein [Streptacidiphilus jiangxiensis]|uniref:trypsin-like peptidase domain-containing protein n=1 Tax=Streptacidiphilus jiangxiensis TaxID=235985 RepID=UPI0013765438|nr:trypsin-like peptidase domain-containing protein [Streptacidiphilus jiangxiensis]
MGGPPLIVVLADRQYLFPVGSVVRIGRNPELDVVSTSPLVSRACHAVISVDAGGATYVDQSRRGTFLRGRPLRGPLRITESVELRLGDPVTGEVLGVTPPLGSHQLERNRRRRLALRRGRMAGLALGAMGVAAAVLAALLLPSGATPKAAAHPSAGATATTAPLALAEAATVRLRLGPADASTGWGSGTVVDPHGLILTNAHVAQPQAPGQAVALGTPGYQLPANPPFLTVEMTTGQSTPAVARYRARPVAVDGYLDLAVVQIYADAAGKPVDPSTLRLPALTIGDSGALQLGQPVTVLGFPGVAESDSISVTSGVLSTFVPDPLHHAADPRFELETTARLAHGNSGGAAIDAGGRLIGVPSMEVTGEGADVSYRLRAAQLARPLLAAARAGRTYGSVLLVHSGVGEKVTGVGVGGSGEQACAISAPATLAALPAQLWVGLRYAGLPKGLDVAVGVRPPGAAAFGGAGGALPEETVPGPDGCLAVAVDPASFGLASLPPGTYQAQLFAGPDLDPVGGTAQFRVGG